jgi:hypothetical protein
MTDAFDDFFEEPELIGAQTPPPPKKRSSGGCLNLLSGIFVAGTIVVGLLFGIIFTNPQHDINPLPPTTLPALFLTYTPTPPAKALPATWTQIPSPTLTVTVTLEPTPTETPQPTLDNTPIPTADLESGVTFGKQDSSPSYEINTVHMDAGCNWLGVAGQIFDLDGQPISGILIEAGGNLGSQEVTRITLSGMAPNYGEGGYELAISDTPVVSDGDVWVQLLDQANLPLSDKIYFQTYDSCDSNLIKINFTQLNSQ